MINLLLPPLYQQQYFAQPKPQLYEPPLSFPQTSPNSANDFKPSNDTDQIQNESPINATSYEDNIPISIDPQFNLNEITTLAIDDTTETITEKQLEFKPVQKKIGDRVKQSRCVHNIQHLFRLKREKHSIQLVIANGYFLF